MNNQTASPPDGSTAGMSEEGCANVTSTDKNQQKALPLPISMTCVPPESAVALPGKITSAFPSPSPSSSPSVRSPPPRPGLEPFGEPGKISTLLREVGGIGTLVCAMLATQSQLSQVLLPMNEIAITFGVQDDPGRQSWLIAAYSMSVSTVILPAGRLGDMYGNKRLVLLGFAWASLGSLLCGLATYTGSDIAFDVFRAIQGIGFSIALPNAVAVLSRASLAGDLRRMIYFTIFAASAPNGFLFGAIFSSIIAQYHPIQWAFSFYLAAVCLLFLSLLGWYTIPSDEYLTQYHLAAEWEKTESKEDLKPVFDWLGTLFALVGLILVNFAWSQAAVVGWQEPYIGILLGVGLLSLGLFVYVEHKVQDPLIPTDIWTTQTTVVLACVALGWASFGSWQFYSIRWWINLRGATLLSATAMATPVGVGGCLAVVLCALILTHAGPTWTMLSALVAFFLSSILIATMPEQQTYWTQSFLSWCIGPFGMDQSFPAASLLIAASLPPNKQGVASSLVNTIVNWSVAIGLGIAATVEVKTDDEGADIPNGYRSATYMGSGLAGLGVVLAAGNVVATILSDRKKRKRRGGDVTLTVGDAVEKGKVGMLREERRSPSAMSTSV